MIGKKLVTGTKVITGNRDADFVSVSPFEISDEKNISDENVVNAIACDIPCKILQNFTLALTGCATPGVRGGVGIAS